MNTYIIKINHNGGTTTLYVNATTEKNAINKAMNFQDCNEGVIYSVRKLPNFIKHL